MDSDRLTKAFSSCNLEFSFKCNVNMYRNSMESGQWRWILKSNHKKESRNKAHVISPEISIIYVTNFPESVLSIHLWRVCGRLDKIVDVFISKKRSRMGKCWHL